MMRGFHCRRMADGMSENLIQSVIRLARNHSPIAEKTVKRLLTLKQGNTPKKGKPRCIRATDDEWGTLQRLFPIVESNQREAERIIDKVIRRTKK